MEKFTASNGWTVTDLEDGQGSVMRPVGNLEYVFWLGPTEADVLREYFQSERDAELGRWRWSESPEYVVYRVPEHDDSDGRCVRIMRETDGFCCFWWERLGDGDDELFRAARAYFDARPDPVPRPWENAKPGEVWALTDSTGERTYLVGEAVRFFPLPLLKPEDAGWEPARFASEFVSGRRIWPEGETTT